MVRTSSALPACWQAGMRTLPSFDQHASRTPVTIFSEKWEELDDLVSMERQKDSSGCAKNGAASFL